MSFNLTAIVFSGIALLYFGAQLLILVRVARRVPVLVSLPLEELEKWPRVSIIITACNEERSLEAAVASRFEEDYPELEIILVEDRSTDSTPEIAGRLAAAHPTVKVRHITELPKGWLGKVNALKEGLEQASGEWVLFSDGDVSFHKGVLRRAVAYCESHGFDHCAILPGLRPVHPVLDCLTSIFLRLVALNFRIWAIEDPRSAVGVGIGAFNLVRRSALEKTPGLEYIRMEVGDDLALGQMLKACGARQTVLNGRDLMDIEFHSSIGDSLRSAERATYTSIGNFNLARLSLVAVATLILELSPLIALAAVRSPLDLIFVLPALVVALAAMLVPNRMWGRASWNLVLFPIATFIFCYSMVRSGVLGVKRGGIIWRGTFYPNDELKAGRRYGRAWKDLAPHDRR